MPKFLDCISIDDLEEHEEQVKALTSLMPKKWTPPDSDGSGVDVPKKKRQKELMAEKGKG